MDQLPFADTLEVLGFAVGALLVLVGLGTLSGLPWQTAETIVVAVVQILGALVAIGIGVGLAWVVRTDESPI
jgi:hypothetical protein